MASNEHELRVPVVILNKKNVVVDLGGEHLVDLVDLQKNIKIETDVDTFYFNEIFGEGFDEAQFYSNGPIGKKVQRREVNCVIPLISSRSIGGRHTKVRRPRRVRATRRTTRQSRRV